MNQIKKEIDKYVIPFLLFVSGILTLIVGMDQLFLFTLGGIGLISAGILSGLYSAGLISKMVNVILLLLLLGGSGAYAYYDYHSIASVLKFKEKVAVYKAAVTQRLKDIRDAQKGFELSYGRYASDLDSLIHFVKYDSIMLVKSEGNIPDQVNQMYADSLGTELYDLIVNGMTVEQTLALSKMQVAPPIHFIRDTFFVAAREHVFHEGDSAWEAKRTYPFHLDSIKTVPYSRGKLTFLLETGFIPRKNTRLPVFLATDPAPVDPKKDAWSIGSMDEPKTNGNWE